jgi:glycosyltransferase involved in cell wall biosynthesis
MASSSTHKATVAVVMTNYNHARYLGESLGGIAAQTRPADEVIIFDDGSTDESVRIIDLFAAARPSIRVLKNPRNLGVQGAIARAIELVRADYFIWTAADDRLLPGFLERSMAALERHPRAALCFSETTQLLGDTGRIERFAADAGVRRIFDLADLPEYCGPEDLRVRMKRAYLPIASNTVIVKRSLLLDFGGYPRELEWLADSFAYTALALRHGACVVPETLALIRAVPGSYSQSMKDPSRQRNILESFLELLARPPYRDIRPAYRACPSNLSPTGNLMLRVLVRRPKDWDLFLSYFWWKIQQHKLHHRLSWPGVAASGIRWLYGRVRSWFLP